VSRVIIALEEYNMDIFITDRWKLLFTILKSQFGFEFWALQRIADLKGLEEMEVVVLCVSPETFGRWSSQILNSVQARRKAKLILYVYDLWNDEEGFDSLLSEADVILSTVDEKFRILYSDFVDKMEFFPLFFSPYWRYANFSLNETPIMRCLLAGKVEPIYPLRMFVKGECEKGNHNAALVDVLPTYGLTSGLQKEAIVKEDFARKLRDYFCVVSSSVYGCVVAKTLEVCATGALLLTDYISDMSLMGFVPFKHFIPVTTTNVFFRVSDCLSYPTKYAKVRYAGMQLVRGKHSIKNRVRQFDAVLKGLK